MAWLDRVSPYQDRPTAFSAEALLVAEHFAPTEPGSWERQIEWRVAPGLQRAPEEPRSLAAPRPAAHF